jgi:hypothetical protein
MRAHGCSAEAHRIAFGFSPPDDRYFATLSAGRYDFDWETNFPRTRGINHVVQIVHRPGDQMSFVSESIGPDDRGGVRLTLLAAWFRDCDRFISVGKAWAVEPFAMASGHARGMLRYDFRS